MKMRFRACFCRIVSIQGRGYESCSVCSFNPPSSKTNLHSPLSFFGTINAGLANSLSEGSIHLRSMNSFNSFFMASARSP